MSTEGKYVAAAYLVVFVVVLAYVLIIALKLQRLNQEVAELVELAQKAGSRIERRSRLAELLFWPALLAYGEAAVAYLGEAPAPGRAGRLATWGVRIGWLVQTALLVVAGRARGRLPLVDVGRVAQPVRLARRRRVPDLGLPAALPVARARRCCPLRSCCSCSRGSAAARGRPAAATTRTCSSSSTSGSCSRRSRASRSPPRLSVLYLWQERRLKRHERAILRVRAPVAGDARRGRRPHDRVRAARTHARHRRRHRPARATAAAASTRSWP